MTDQNIINQAPVPEPEAKPTATAPEKTGGKTYTEAELEQIVKDRLAREKAKADKAAAEAAEKAAAEEAARQGEWKKLAEAREKEAAELKAQLAARELADKKRAVATKYGLPDALALRLAGNTDEELEADAKALAELMPKTAKPAPGPTNPGQNASAAETHAQKIARIYGSNVDMFDPREAEKRGGGVIFNAKE